MEYTQQNRHIAIATSLGEDVLLLQGFRGRESISRLFKFDLELLSHQPGLDFMKIVGQNVTLTLLQADGTPRYFNGMISRFFQSTTDEKFFHYHAEMVPWLWFLTRGSDCRIFQNKSIPDIIKQVFSDLKFSDFKDSTQETYKPLDYVVQYRETHFNFVSRLMEEFGIFYFFEHENGKHTMVLADSASAHQPCTQQTVHYHETDLPVGEEDTISDWGAQQELRTGKYALSDYNFETPSTNLLADDPTVVSVGGNSGYEIYDYPGDYLTKDEGSSLAKIRMEEEESTHLVMDGKGNVRSFSAGCTFELQDHYRDDANTTYVLTEIEHVASAGQAYFGREAAGPEMYTNHFTCIRKDVPYRPIRLTPKPIIQGPQTALVVGPSGEEIYVDKYGRVKVHFYWDRHDKKDENSSCWIRVSQPWAGKNWGGMWIPRIGQEVVVNFIDGDPDRPLITGRVYNAEVMPPYTLPDYSTRSTMMSRSSKGGGTANYNELRFEDKKGSEQIFINAEKDMDHRVENNSREFIGASRNLIVTKDQLEQVQGDKHGTVKGNHIEKITGDMSLQVGGSQLEKTGKDKGVDTGGDHKEKIAKSCSLQIGKDQNTKVGGNVSLTVSQNRNEKIGSTHAMEATQTIHLKGGMTVVIEAGMELSLKGPGGFVDIGPAGVTIQGTMVMINSGGSAGSGPGASPDSPDSPDAPKDPKDPDTADDGSKGGKLN